MTDLISPDRARELLNGATAEPWALAQANGWLVVAATNSIAEAYFRDDASLIAAAPDLARALLAYHAAIVQAIQLEETVGPLAAVGHLRLFLQENGATAEKVDG